MRHKLCKIFTVAAHEKEEQWLNEMSAKGLQLVDYHFLRYTFEEGPPGKYMYRLELLKHLPPHPESQRYLQFMEDMGVVHIASYMRWVYFRKEAGGEPFDIYTDLDSRILHYKRILSLISSVLMINLFAVLINILPRFIPGHASQVNTSLSMVNLLISIMLCTLLVSVHKRRNQLKRERTYRE